MTTTAVETPTGWRYPDLTRRDLRLDWLRGFALFAMAINHFGLHQSFLHEVSGRSEFLINAAEVFFFVSGMTLGVIAVREPLRHSVSRLLRRTFVVYLTVLGLAFGFATVAMATDLMLWDTIPAFTFAGMWDWVWNVLTLREAPFGADVLVAYVVYLGVAPLALWALSNGRGRRVALVILGVYALSQVAPETVEVPLASFRGLAANAPVFFGGLLVGWYRDDLARWFRSAPDIIRRLSVAADLVVVVLGVGLGFAYANAFESAPWLGAMIGDDFGVREAAMPLPPLLVVFLYLRLLWLVIDHGWRPFDRLLGWFVLPLGQASLFTYAGHIVAMAIVWNLPGYTEDVGRWGATAWVIAYLGLLYGGVRFRVWARGRLLADDERRRRLHRLPEAVVAGLFMIMVATAGLVADDRAAAIEAEEAEVIAVAAAWVEPLERADVPVEVWFEEERLFLGLEWQRPGEIGEALDGGDAWVWWEEGGSWVEVGVEVGDDATLERWRRFWEP